METKTVRKSEEKIKPKLISVMKGCGYATEAVTAITEWALKQDKIYCVIAEVDKNNIASIRVLEKSGFELTDKVGEEGPIYKKEYGLID